MSSHELIDGPWRATRLWNSIVRSLQQGMPCKRHWRQLKCYENCFTSAEAIDWLHRHLKKNPNFDGHVTKEQTVLLLQKLLKAGVIVCVCPPAPQHPATAPATAAWSPSTGLTPCSSASSNTYYSSTFRQPNELYRLASPDTIGLHTPKKSSISTQQIKAQDTRPDPPQSRSPLSAVNYRPDSPSSASSTFRFRKSFRKTTNKYRSLLSFELSKSRGEADELLEQDPGSGDDDQADEAVADKSCSYSLQDRQNLNLIYLQSLPPNSLVVLDDNDQTWREVYLSQLRSRLTDLHLVNLPINLSHIIYNMTNVSCKGVVQIAASDKSQDLPRWCLSAMKCLANWPLASEQRGIHLPDYKGFEVDVFNVVQDYFSSLKAPLLTYELYDIFVSAYIKAESMGVRANCRRLNMYDDDQQKDVGQGQQRIAQVRNTHLLHTASSSKSVVNLADGSGLTADMSATAIMRNFLPPNTCFETVFMNETPVTRIVPQKGTETLTLCRQPSSERNEPNAATPLPLPSGTLSLLSQGDEECGWVKQPKWKRTCRFRKSIAVMEANNEGAQPAPMLPVSAAAAAAPALPSLVSQSKKDFTSVDNLLSCNERGSRLVPDNNYSRRTSGCGEQQPKQLRRQSFSEAIASSAPLSPAFAQDVTSQRGNGSKQPTSGQWIPPDNMILSKAVRKEKRKQRNKRRERSHSSSSSSYCSNLQQCSEPCELAAVDKKLFLARAEPYHNLFVMTPEAVNCAIDSFKLLGLLLPPANRRRLQLLLKFMKRVSSKEKLRLDPAGHPAQQVVLTAFCEAIIKPLDLLNHDEEVCLKIVQFFVDHYDHIWTPPVSLRREVEEKVYLSLVSKRLEAGEDPYPITFCKRVPSKVYEKERRSGAETALAELLDHMVADSKMSLKDKKKKLLKFREAYPHIYKQKFPTADHEPDYMRQGSSPAGSRSSIRLSSLTRLKNAMRI